MDFDLQSSLYDNRVGLPEAIPTAIAKILVNFAGNSKLRVLEIGAGTGEIGCEIVHVSSLYRAIDNSKGMLEQFEIRAKKRGMKPELLHHDGNNSWPAFPGQFNMVFSSRALHLLDPNHVVREIVRLAQHETLRIVIGRVKKESDSIPANMRKTMLIFLKEEGYEGISGMNRRRNLQQELLDLGGEEIPLEIVGKWKRFAAPLDFLNSWHNKEGLAGRTIPLALKEKILHKLKIWALEKYKDLRQPSQSTCTYELSGIVMKNK